MFKGCLPQGRQVSSPVGCCPAPALVIKMFVCALAFILPTLEKVTKYFPLFKFTSHISSNWIKTYCWGDLALLWSKVHETDLEDRTLRKHEHSVVTWGKNWFPESKSMHIKTLPLRINATLTCKPSLAAWFRVLNNRGQWGLHGASSRGNSSPGRNRHGPVL